MLWLQEYDWNLIIPADYLTIWPNPRFNELEKPIKLPQYLYPEIFQLTYDMMRQYIEYKKFGIKPWDWKGAYYNEDIRMIEMFDIMFDDAQKYKAAKEKADAALKQMVDEEKRKGKGQAR